MKFKILFISFNIVLIFSFLTIFCIPFFVMDGTFFAKFWFDNWYLIGLFILILFSVNTVYLLHHTMLTYIEQQDWPALAQYLEIRVFHRGRCTFRNVRLLCESMLLLGDFDGIRRLDSWLADKKPVFRARLGSRMAAAYVLGTKYDALDALFVSLVDSKDVDRNWLLFYNAFSHQLRNAFAVASETFIDLALTSSDPVVTLLSGYLCAKTASRSDNTIAGTPKTAQLVSASESAFSCLRSKYSASQWQRVVEDAKSGMEVIVLAKLVDEASLCLYPPSAH